MPSVALSEKAYGAGVPAVVAVGVAGVSAMVVVGGGVRGRIVVGYGACAPRVGDGGVGGVGKVREEGLVGFVWMSPLTLTTTLLLVWPGAKLRVPLVDW